MGTGIAAARGIRMRGGRPARRRTARKGAYHQTPIFAPISKPVAPAPASRSRRERGPGCRWISVAWLRREPSAQASSQPRRGHQMGLNRRSKQVVYADDERTTDMQWTHIRRELSGSQACKQKPHKQTCEVAMVGLPVRAPTSRQARDDPPGNRGSSACA